MNLNNLLIIEDHINYDNIQYNIDLEVKRLKRLKKYSFYKVLIAILSIVLPFFFMPLIYFLSNTYFRYWSHTLLGSIIEVILFILFFFLFFFGIFYFDYIKSEKKIYNQYCTMLEKKGGVSGYDFLMAQLSILGLNKYRSIFEQKEDLETLKNEKIEILDVAIGLSNIKIFYQINKIDSNSQHHKVINITKISYNKESNIPTAIITEDGIILKTNVSNRNYLYYE